MRGVLQRLMYSSSRPKVRTAHVASRRLADESPPLGGWNLMRGVAQDLTYIQRASTLRAVRIRTRF